MSTTGFLLGVSLDATPGISATELLPEQVTAARILDSHGFDFLTVGDDFAGTPFDAGLSASLISARTRQIGLVPTITTTHTEPFHTATATATLDYTGCGRAGWSPQPSLDVASAAAVGRRRAPRASLAWDEAAGVVEVVRALWDSWEDGAEIRDVRSGRFIDRGKLHYIDATLNDGEGAPYTVKGPSIVPRPPQGHPPVFITVADEHSRRAALSVADGAVLPADSVDQAIDRAAELPDVLVLPSLQVPAVGQAAWLRATTAALVDASLPGLHLRLQDLRADVPALAREVVDSAGRYGVHRRGSLRERLGLGVAGNRFDTR